MSLFRKLFGGKQTAQSSQASAPQLALNIGEMDLAEVVGLIGSFGNDAPVAQLISIYRRLYEIGFFEHGLTEDERTLALRLCDGLQVDIEASLDGNPEALEAFREAVDDHADKVQFYGFGSLQWIMDEHAVGADQLIPFAVMPEFADLLPTYLTMLPDDVMIGVRGEILRHLIRARRKRTDQSDVRVLHSLVIEADRAAAILLRTDEFRMMQNMAEDYQAAEAFVASLMNSKD